MKLIGNQASILNGTNKAISNSYADWSGIRQGSYFKFNGDANFYLVDRTESTFYIKDCEVVSSSILKTNDDVSVNLQEGDTVTITYKEYELARIISILNAGKGYQAGDILFVSDGTPSIDIQNNVSLLTSIKVTEVQPGGVISGVAINYRGRYLSAPKNEISLVGGNGEGAKFSLEYKIIEDRKTVEKDLVRVEIQPNESFLHLSYPIPDGLKEVKVSVKKWLLFLTSNYLGGTKINKEFDVARDFTFKLNIPLLTKGSFSTDLIFNQAMTILEGKITELEDRIKKLES